MNKKQVIVFAILSFGLFSTLGFFSLKTIVQKRELSGVESSEIPETKDASEKSNQETFSPTLAPEKEKIVSQLVTHEIVIKDDSFNPSDIDIKAYDQVSLKNNSDKDCKLNSEGASEVTISPGESFTRVFEKTGVYRFFCQDNPELKGNIRID
ncbi:MAG: cupredoxin domain-containing protein [Patescibacteria group bacterium]|nr:cupredoxin domain-containing protein [Patescibacteria group bacterium]